VHDPVGEEADGEKRKVYFKQGVLKIGSSFSGIGVWYRITTYKAFSRLKTLRKGPPSLTRKVYSYLRYRVLVLYVRYTSVSTVASVTLSLNVRLCLAQT